MSTLNKSPCKIDKNTFLQEESTKKSNAYNERFREIHL